MIVDRKLSFRSVTINIRRENLIFFLISLLVTLVYRRLNFNGLTVGVAPLTILGAAITIFLGFRTNTAYDRWWEARILWGALVNQSRTIVRQAMTFCGSDEALPPGSEPESGDDDLVITPFVRRIAHLQIAFANATRAHLRKQDPLKVVEPHLPDDVFGRLAGQQNVPSALLQQMGLELRRARRQKLLDTIQFTALDATLIELTNILGGCERIKNTPLPRQYDTVPRFGIYAFSLMLPLGLVSTLGWWTPFVCAIITFLFIAIDSIGSNIEDPFENKIHDVPMTTLCRTIEINITQMIGEKECPNPLEPTFGVLI